MYVCVCVCACLCVYLCVCVRVCVCVCVLLSNGSAAPPLCPLLPMALCVSLYLWNCVPSCHCHCVLPCLYQCMCAPLPVQRAFVASGALCLFPPASVLPCFCFPLLLFGLLLFDSDTILTSYCLLLSDLASVWLLFWPSLFYLPLTITLTTCPVHAATVISSLTFLALD